MADNEAGSGTHTTGQATQGKEAEVFRVGAVGFFATGDHVLIREDEFKSGYECPTCGGVGTLACPECDGSGKSAVVPDARCKSCNGDQKITCPECEGKGGLLVVPDQSQRRPTTGEIVSVGPECGWRRVGDTVMFSNFSGHAVDLDRAGHKVVLRILHEKEILCGVEGHLELRTVRHKTELTSI